MIPDIQTVDHLKHLAGLKAEEKDTLDKAKKIVTEAGTMTIDGEIDDYEWIGSDGEEFIGYVKYTAEVNSDSGDVVDLKVTEGGVHDELAAWGISQDHIDYEIADMNKDINHFGNETIIDDARYEWEQETGMYSGGHEDMDGDHDSAMASAGMGTDEDYGYYGESAKMRKFANIVKASEGSEQIPHNCAIHVEHKEFGKGFCIREQHTLTEEGNVSHYNVRFRKHGIKEMVAVDDLKILKERAHTHKKGIKSTVKKMSEDADMRKLSKIVTEGDKQREVLTEDGAKTDKQVVTESVKKKPKTLKEYIEVLEDHLKEADMEIRNIPASDKAKRSLYMPADYFKHLGNKNKEIGWKQNRDLGQGSSLDSDYKYKQKPVLIDPETGDHVPIGSADLANTKYVGGSKKIKLKTPYGTQTHKDTEQHAYNPHEKDTWRRDVRGKRLEIPGASSTDNSEVSYDYGKHGMYAKDIAAAKEKRWQERRGGRRGTQTTSTSFGKSSDINKPNVITKKIGS